MSDSEQRVVRIVYRNHRGVTASRRILPHAMYFGSNEWHLEAQWLLDGYDLELRAPRSFAMKNILSWLGPE